ncbi:MAG: hypothetical protein HC831_08560 [Chloroflexia bacterium]|nr:hypothetical protein [Chloroflexia bacterium]
METNTSKSPIESGDYKLNGTNTRIDYPFFLWSFVFLFASLANFFIQSGIAYDGVVTVLNLAGILSGFLAILITLYFIAGEKAKSSQERLSKYYWFSVFVLYYAVATLLKHDFDYVNIEIYRLNFVGFAVVIWGILNKHSWLIYGGILITVSPFFVGIVHFPYQYLAIACIWMFTILHFFLAPRQKKAEKTSPSYLDATA